MSRTLHTSPEFGLLGSEIRTRVAMAFVPDPRTPVSARQIGETVGRPGASLGDPLSQLRHVGLLNRIGMEVSGDTTYERTDHPLWAVYEAAKVAFAAMEIEVESIVVDTDSEPKS